MSDSFSILCISGPNLQLLGRREPHVYGRKTLQSIHDDLRERSFQLGVTVDMRQSNHEGEIVTWIGDALDHHDGILINPGAYTHTSIAIHDAIQAVALPTIELHLSNVDAREPFRRHSQVAPACVGRVSGFGALSYRVALDGLVAHLRERASHP